MNEEIKEILESLNKIAKTEYYPEDLLTYKECEILLNYIINLQKENEELLKKLEDVSLDEANIRADILLEQQDYKQRKEKAVEYIKNNKDKVITTYGDDYDYETCLFKEDIDDLLNILEGGDE